MYSAVRERRLVTNKKRNPDPDGSAPESASPTGPSLATNGEVLERLLDLAYDVSSYLRHRAQPTIRVSAALLLAASLAACSSSPPPPTSPNDVAPLSQEVRNGLPNRPGTYPILPETLTRDQQGVYHFQYRQPGANSGQGTPATVSLLKLNQSNANTLEIPASGDPILNITENTPIQMANTSSGGGYSYWRPFYGGYYYGPRYYDPPYQTFPSGGSGNSSTTIDGSRSSTAPPPAAARTIGAAHAVSGQAGGTGAGTAASGKAGVGGGSSTSGGGKSSAAAPASSGFSGGKGGASSSGGGGSSSAGSSST